MAVSIYDPHYGQSSQGGRRRMSEDEAEAYVPRTVFRSNETGRRLKMISRVKPGLSKDPGAALALAEGYSNLDDDQFLNVLAKLTGFAKARRVAEQFKHAEMRPDTVDHGAYVEKWKGLDRQQRRLLREFGVNADLFADVDDDSGGWLGDIIGAGVDVLDTVTEPLQWAGAQAGKAAMEGLEVLMEPLKMVQQGYRVVSDAADELGVPGLVPALAVAAMPFGGWALAGGAAIAGGLTIAANEADPEQFIDTWERMGIAGGEGAIKRNNRDKALEILGGERRSYNLAFEMMLTGDPYETARKITAKDFGMDEDTPLVELQKNPKFNDHYGQIIKRLSEKTIKRAVTTLGEGKMSPGRDLARGIGLSASGDVIDVPLLGDVDVYDVVSGLADAAFDIYYDPIFAVAKMTKTARLEGLAIGRGEGLIPRYYTGSEAMIRSRDGSARTIFAPKGVIFTDMAENFKNIVRSDLDDIARPHNIGDLYHRTGPKAGLLNTEAMKAYEAGMRGMNQFERFVASASDVFRGARPDPEALANWVRMWNQSGQRFGPVLAAADRRLRLDVSRRIEQAGAAPLLGEVPGRVTETAALFKEAGIKMGELPDVAATTVRGSSIAGVDSAADMAAWIRRDRLDSAAGMAPARGLETVEDFGNFFNDIEGVKALLSGASYSPATARSVWPGLTKVGMKRMRVRLKMGGVIDWMADKPGRFEEALKSLDPTVDYSHLTKAKSLLARPDVAAIGVTGSLLRSLTRQLPHGMAVSLSSTEGAVDFGRMLEISLPYTMRAKFYGEYLLASNTAAKRSVVAQGIRAVAEHFGVPADYIDDFIKKSGAFEHRYSADPKLSMITNGTQEWNASIWEHQLADDLVTIPAFRDLARASRKANIYRSMFGSINNPVTGTVMDKYWKPAVLLRLGFIPRAIGEEVLARIALEGPGNLFQNWFLVPLHDRTRPTGVIAAGTEGTAAETTIEELTWYLHPLGNLQRRLVNGGYRRDDMHVFDAISRHDPAREMRIAIAANTDEARPLGELIAETRGTEWGQARTMYGRYRIPYRMNEITWAKGLEDFMREHTLELVDKNLLRAKELYVKYDIGSRAQSKAILQSNIAPTGPDLVEGIKIPHSLPGGEVEYILMRPQIGHFTEYTMEDYLRGDPGAHTSLNAIFGDAARDFDKRAFAGVVANRVTESKALEVGAVMHWGDDMDVIFANIHAVRDAVEQFRPDFVRSLQATGFYPKFSLNEADDVVALTPEFTRTQARWERMLMEPGDLPTQNHLDRITEVFAKWDALDAGQRQLLLFDRRSIMRDATSRGMPHDGPIPRPGWSAPEIEDLNTILREGVETGDDSVVKLLDPLDEAGLSVGDVTRREFLARKSPEDLHTELDALLTRGHSPFVRTRGRRDKIVLTRGEHIPLTPAQRSEAQQLMRIAETKVAARARLDDPMAILEGQVPHPGVAQEVVAAVDRRLAGRSLPSEINGPKGILDDLWATADTDLPGARLPLTEQQFVDEFDRLEDITVRAEKPGYRADWTPEQQRLYDAGDWEAFSRSRGYTEAEIDDFRRFGELVGDSPPPPFMMNGLETTDISAEAIYAHRYANGTLPLSSELQHKAALEELMGVNTSELVDEYIDLVLARHGGADMASVAGREELLRSELAVRLGRPGLPRPSSRSIEGDFMRERRRLILEATRDGSDQAQEALARHIGNNMATLPHRVRSTLRHDRSRVANNTNVARELADDAARVWLPVLSGEDSSRAAASLLQAQGNANADLMTLANGHLVANNVEDAAAYHAALENGTLALDDTMVPFGVRGTTNLQEAQDQARRLAELAGTTEYTVAYTDLPRDLVLRRNEIANRARTVDYGKGGNQVILDPLGELEARNLTIATDNIVELPGGGHGIGPTFEDAVDQMSQVRWKDTKGELVSPNGEPLYELAVPIAGGFYDVEHLTHVAFDRLNPTWYGPLYAVHDPHLWENLVRYGFDRVIAPKIEAIIRRPMFLSLMKDAIAEGRGAIFSRMRQPFTHEFAIDTVNKYYGHIPGEKMKFLTEGSRITKTYNEEQISTMLDDVTDVFHVWEKTGDRPTLLSLRNLEEADGISFKGPLANLLDDEAALVKRVADTPIANTPARDEAIAALQGFRDETDEFLDTMQRWFRNEDRAQETLANVAAERAFVNAIPFIDDSAIRSQAGEYLRNLVPFYFAEEQFLKRWARVIKASPEGVRRLQLGYMGLRHAGVIRKNDRGEEVFVYPGTAELSNLLGGVVGPILGAQMTMPISTPLTGQVRYSLPGLDSTGVPAAGPLIGIPLTLLANRFPELAPAEEFMLGERGAGRSVLDQIVPTSVKRFWEALTQDPATNAGYASAMMNTIQYMEANDLTPDDDANSVEIEEYLDRVENHTRIALLLRAFVGFIGPAAPAPEVPDSAIKSEYRTLLQALPIEEAVSALIAQYPDANPYTVFQSEVPSRANIPASRAALDYVDQNPAIFNNYPLGGPWLIPQEDTTDTYYARAYNQQLSVGLRERRSPAEYYRELKFAKAAPDFFDTREKYERKAAEAPTPEARDRVNAEFRAWKDAYLQQHPIFAEELVSPDSHNRRLAILEDTRLALDDPRLPKHGAYKEIRRILEVWDELQRKTEELRYDPTSDAAEVRANLKVAAYNFLENYTRKHSRSRAFYLRVLQPEIGLDSIEMDDLEAQYG